jgi:hypothetical protein
MTEAQNRKERALTNSTSAASGFAGKSGRVLQDNRLNVVQRQANDHSGSQKKSDPEEVTVQLQSDRVSAVVHEGVVQLARGPKRGAKTARKKKAARHRARVARAKKGAQKLGGRSRGGGGGGGRYPGHDSAANKRALIDVLNHRKKSLHKSLSHPEETARSVSKNSGKPETGLQNVTASMIRGTAICHKISDKSIRDKITSLFEAEKKSKDKVPLDSYLISLVNYISPAHAKDETPSGGDYAAEASNKHSAAFSARLEMIVEKAGSANRLAQAHIVGRNVANSPVNLFLGDSITNSSIQAHFDQNTYAAPSGHNPPPTPRSRRASPVNDLVNDDFAALDLDSGRTKKSSRPGDV